MSTTKAYVFDAYGTLFDVHSVQDRCEEQFPGHGAKLTVLWRSKQLEYTWLRSLVGRYQDFWQITKDALAVSCQTLSVTANAEQIDQLMQSYLTLRLYPEWSGALNTLAGTPLGILSNGTPTMLQSLVENAGWTGRFKQVLSVDAVKVYKPHPSVYGLAVTTLGVKPEEIVFVSSNGWDVAGAKAFGFQTVWLNRAGSPVEALGVQPDRIITSPVELCADQQRLGTPH
jgi:2-haloacid dehalogenase